MGGGRYEAIVVGGGPAGIGAAEGLHRHGIGPVLLIERSHRLGGIPRSYGDAGELVPTFVDWRRARVLAGGDLADRLADRLRATGTETWLASQVIDARAEDLALTVVGPRSGAVRVTARVVLLACGARERTAVEKGWITGARPARVFSTLQLLESLRLGGGVPLCRPILLGSDLIAYSAAAILRSAGAADCRMIDRARFPRAGPAARLYFARWVRPVWVGRTGGVVIRGEGAVEGIETAEGRFHPCDGVVVGGELVPASELVQRAGLEVRLPSRRPTVLAGGHLTRPGWFAAGNITGGSRGALRCYRQGKRAAAMVARYLGTA